MLSNKALMKNLILSLLLIAIPGQGVEAVSLERCLALRKQWESAREVGDHKAQERISLQMIADCDEHERGGKSNYRFLAVTKHDQEDWQGLLAASKTCVADDYRTVRCHLLEAVALYRLGRNQEAYEQASRTADLVELLFDEASKEREGAVARLDGMEGSWDLQWEKETADVKVANLRTTGLEALIVKSKSAQRLGIEIDEAAEMSRSFMAEQ